MSCYGWKVRDKIITCGASATADKPALAEVILGIAADASAEDTQLPWG